MSIDHWKGNQDTSGVNSRQRSLQYTSGIDQRFLKKIVAFPKEKSLSILWSSPEGSPSLDQQKLKGKVVQQNLPGDQSFRDIVVSIPFFDLLSLFGSKIGNGISHATEGLWCRTDAVQHKIPKDSYPSITAILLLSSVMWMDLLS